MMCEFSGKLIAWMDGEVAPREAAEIAGHVEKCAECRNCITEFARVSGEFAQYCDAMLAAQERWAARRWAPALCAAAAVAAALVALVMAFLPVRVQRPSAPIAVVVASASPELASKAVPREAAPANASTRLKHPAASVRNGATFPHLCSGPGCVSTKNVSRAPEPAVNDAAIQIAIPAEAMFPPGAVPDGVNFVADVSIGADGNVQELRLRPRLIRFERSAN